MPHLYKLQFHSMALCKALDEATTDVKDISTEHLRLSCLSQLAYEHVQHKAGICSCLA